MEKFTRTELYILAMGDIQWAKAGLTYVQNGPRVLYVGDLKDSSPFRVQRSTSEKSGDRKLS